jgi:hypothetical protein
MTFEQLFNLFNSLALLAWIPLFLPPAHKLRTWFIDFKAGPVLMAIFYVLLFISFLAMADENTPPIDFSFEGIKTLFASEQGILIGWVHYLAFDMMVGIYEAEDAKKRAMPHGLLIPCLIFTFMLGPLGWLMYWIISRFYPIKSS